MTDSGLPPTPTQSLKYSGLERAGLNRREHALIGERRAGTAAPGHRRLPDQRREQVELLLEQLLVLAELVSEQGEGLGERAAPENDLGACVRRGIERREPLEYANRVIRAEHGHRRAKTDPARASCNRRQHDLGRRHGEVGAVVLPNAEKVDADRIGEDRLVDDVADHLRMRPSAGKGGSSVPALGS